MFIVAPGNHAHAAALGSLQRRAFRASSSPIVSIRTVDLRQPPPQLFFDEIAGFKTRSYDTGRVPSKKVPLLPPRCDRSIELCFANKKTHEEDSFLMASFLVSSSHDTVVKKIAGFGGRGDRRISQKSSSPVAPARVNHAVVFTHAGCI